MFGFSGIWKSPATTIPGLLSAVLGMAVALGWISQEMVPQMVAVVGPVLVGIIGLLYKGQAE